jgi:hypothetical protein
VVQWKVDLSVFLHQQPGKIQFRLRILPATTVISSVHRDTTEKQWQGEAKP